MLIDDKWITWFDDWTSAYMMKIIISDIKIE
jgi:hypothetical protein